MGRWGEWQSIGRRGGVTSSKSSYIKTISPHASRQNHRTTPIPHPTTTPSIPQPHPTPYLPPARVLSSIAFNFVFGANFKDFSVFLRVKIASFLHLNAEIEREIIGERWKFGRELVLVIVRGIGKLGRIYL